MQARRDVRQNWLVQGRIAVVVGVSIAGLASSAMGAATLINLGVLPGGSSSDAFAISGDGTTVVGRSFISGTGTRPFRWTAASGMQDLGVLPGGLDATATAVNADGSVVAGWGTFSGAFNRAGRWTAAGGWQNLGLPSPTLLTGGEAYGVSGDGSIVACALGNSSVSVPARWTSATGMVVIAPAATSAVALAISADGSTLVGSNSGQATRWTSSGAQSMGVPSGFLSSSANGVNADGSVATGDVAGLGFGAAFRWTAATGIQSIGTLGGDSAIGRGVSGNGSIIVGSSRTAQNQDRAFVWTAAGGMRDLNVVLSGMGVSIAGFTLTDARGISADGRSIAGIGRLNNQRRAFVINGLNLCPADVAGANQSTTPDGVLTADDVIVFLGWFFASDARADVAGANQSPVPDGSLTADDIIVFLGRFFAGC